MRFVDYLHGLRAKRILVAVPVMAAEQQVGAVGEHDTDIGLSVAAIATIDRAERRRGQGGGHVRVPSFVRCGPFL